MYMTILVNYYISYLHRVSLELTVTIVRIHVENI